MVAADKKPEREKTAYHVLKEEANPRESRFQLVHPNMLAANAEAAIRAYTETVAADDTPNDGSGTYVAVPARSWKPVTVKTETKTVLKLT